MGQIMRLRRIAIDDHHIVDQNNGERHEAAFTTLIKDNGLLWEAELLPRSYGGNSWFGKFAPGRRQRAAQLAAGDRQGADARQGDADGRAQTAQAPEPGPEGGAGDLREDREPPERYELNLYISGEDEATRRRRRGRDRRTEAPPTSPEGSTSQ